MVVRPPLRLEDSFRADVIKAARSMGFHVSHVESHETSAGIPDLNISMDSVDTWLELKVVKMGKVVLRPTQIKWHSDRIKAGGVSFIMILEPDSQEIWLCQACPQLLKEKGAPLWRMQSIVMGSANMHLMILQASRITRSSLNAER